MNNEKVLYRDGQPCKHPGCHSHRTHPCEKCGRIECEGDVLVSILDM